MTVGTVRTFQHRTTRTTRTFYSATLATFVHFFVGTTRTLVHSTVSTTRTSLLRTMGTILNAPRRYFGNYSQGVCPPRGRVPPEYVLQCGHTRAMSMRVIHGYIISGRPAVPLLAAAWRTGLDPRGFLGRCAQKQKSPTMWSG